MDKNNENKNNAKRKGVNRKELLEIYDRNFTEEEYFMNNIAYAFSNEQLQEAMKKLGAKEKSELSTIFGMGDVCLKSKRKELVHWLNSRAEEKQNWLKSLSVKEQNIIIEYELYNHECGYTWDIEPVVELFKGVFTYNDIMFVFHRIEKQ